jgi:hypothetical protein
MTHQPTAIIFGLSTDYPTNFPTILSLLMTEFGIIRRFFAGAPPEAVEG